MYAKAKLFSSTSVFLDSHEKTHDHNGLKNTRDKPQMNGKKSFWTVCPYCYYLYEYDGVYEECCFRCQNCRRPFHGVAVPPPPVGMVVEGKEQYYCGVGCFPLRYDFESCLGGKKGESGDGESCLGEKKEDGEGLKKVTEDVVEISDDSDGDFDNQEVGAGEMVKNGETKGVGLGEMVKNGLESVHGSVRAGEAGSVMQGSRRTEIKKDGMRVMRVKTVARNTKKLLGTGKKNMNLKSKGNLETRREDRGAEFGEGAGENRTESGDKNIFGEGYFDSFDDLELFLGEKDFFVGCD